MRNGGKIVIMDASNKNLFGDFGIANPFQRTIEWYKHHEPEYWAELLSCAGFTDPIISWNSGKLLRYLGIDSIKRTMAAYQVVFFVWR